MLRLATKGGWTSTVAVVKVTSEAKDYAAETALVSGEMRGWRASSPGTQTIRLIFDQPQRLTRIASVNTQKLPVILRHRARFRGNRATQRRRRTRKVG